MEKYQFIFKVNHIGVVLWSGPRMGFENQPHLHLPPGPPLSGADGGIASTHITSPSLGSLI